MRELIYIADDEEHICSMMKTFLENEGYRVEAFANGEQLADGLQKNMPDLLILDVMMPGEDGLSICARLRKESSLPIIIVSAKDSPMDRIAGLTLGSDDYLVKPFLPLELVARVKALLRRSELRQKGREARYTCGNLELWPDSRRVLVDTADFPVTPLEFDFLAYLLRYKEKAVKKEELLREVWKCPEDSDSRMPDDLVKRLRRKMTRYHASARIETVWGYGFRLTESEGIV
jgi:DNA-binding response OmpR family regulator